MSGKQQKNDPVGNIVAYKVDGDDRVHYGSRTSPLVVKGLEKGDLKVVEEVAPDAPTVSRAGDAPNARPASA